MTTSSHHLRSPLKRDNMVTRWPRVQRWFIWGLWLSGWRIADTMMKCFLSNFEILQLRSPFRKVSTDTLYVCCDGWQQCTKMCSGAASNWRIWIHDCSTVVVFLWSRFHLNILQPVESWEVPFFCNEKWHHAFCKSILHQEVAQVQNHVQCLPCSIYFTIQP